LDINGNVVFTVDEISEEVRINLSHIGTGTYFIRVRDPQNGNMCVEKILKQ